MRAQSLTLPASANGCDSAHDLPFVVWRLEIPDGRRYGPAS